MSEKYGFRVQSKNKPNELVDSEVRRLLQVVFYLNINLLTYFQLKSKLKYNYF